MAMSILNHFDHKRSRMDVERSESPSIGKGAVWMDDGNVVISATHPSGEKTYFFKCHKSTLSKQSSVFSDMFTFPPSEEQEKFDGVPLVHLHDSSEDVESLLKYLYDPTRMPRQNFVSSLVNTIKGPARLAKKYQMDVILDHLLSLLKDAWPTRLEDWDRRESVVRAQITSDEDWRPDTPYAVDMIPDPADGIRLAQDLELPTILPVAFYDLHRIYGKTDYRNSRETRSFQFNKLTKYEMHRFILGREKLRDYLVSIIKPMVMRPRHLVNQSLCVGNGLRDNPTEPAQEWPCANAHQLWSQALLTDIYLNDDGILDDPFRILREASTTPAFKAICSLCRSDLEWHLEHQRNELWNKLGDFFTLEDSE